MNQRISVKTGMIICVQKQYSLNGSTEGEVTVFVDNFAYNKTITIVVLNNKINSESYHDILTNNLLTEAPLITSRKYTFLTG